MHQIDSFIKCSGESYKHSCRSEHVFKVSTTSIRARSQMVTLLVNRSVDDDLVKVKPCLRQAFSQVDDDMNLCFIHVLLYNTPNKPK